MFILLVLLELIRALWENVLASCNVSPTWIVLLLLLLLGLQVGVRGDRGT